MHREELSKEAQLDLVDKAIVGDGQALEELLRSTSGLVFNLALRFLGTVHDAEDASQEIAVKIMTRLSTFRKESAFSTWVYRIAVNHLKDCRTHQFANARSASRCTGPTSSTSARRTSPTCPKGSTAACWRVS